MKKVWLSWSSGKDSAWTLHQLREKGEWEVCGLFTTLNKTFDRVAMHAVPLTRSWGGAAFLGSVQFFLISNFGLWVSGISVFPLTLSGLMACYLAGIPYFGRSIASDMVYAGLLFGLHAWLTRAVLPQERVRGTAEVPLP